MASETKELTVEDIGTILSDITFPFYKGFATDHAPQFRKSLTREETHNLLEALHNVVVAIQIQQQEES